MKVPEHVHPTELLHCAAKLSKHNDSLLIEMMASLDRLRGLAAPVLLAVSDSSSTPLIFTEATACEQAAALAVDLKPLVSLLSLKLAADKFTKFIAEDVKDFALKDLVDDEGKVYLAADVCKNALPLVQSFVERATSHMGAYWHSVLKLVVMCFKSITPNWKPLASAMPLDVTKIHEEVLDNPHRQLLNLLHSKVGKAMKDFVKSSLGDIGFSKPIETWDKDWADVEEALTAGKEAAAVSSGPSLFVSSCVLFRSAVSFCLPAFLSEHNVKPLLLVSNVTVM